MKSNTINHNQLNIVKDSNGFRVELEDSSSIYLKDEQGNITAERFPWIDEFLAVKPIGKVYKVLWRFKNGNLAKWIVDSSGFKKEYQDLEKTSLKDIENEFEIELEDSCISCARKLLSSRKFPEALTQWKSLIKNSPTQFFEKCKQDTNILEDIITTIYSNLVKEGDICVDGGAHAGLHTFPLSRLVGDSGKVYAFEALPHIAQRLQERIDRRQISNINLIQKALNNKNTSLKFNFVKNAPGMSGIQKRPSYGGKNPDIEQIEVEAITLDTVLKHETSWRFCKLDLEGAELHALQGAKESIQKFSPFIIFENGRQGSADSYDYSMEDWFSFFESINYKVFDLFGRSFTQKEWINPSIPWYFIAFKSNSLDEKQFKNNY